MVSTNHDLLRPSLIMGFSVLVVARGLILAAKPAAIGVQTQLSILNLFKASVSALQQKKSVEYEILIALSNHPKYTCMCAILKKWHEHMHM